MSLHRTAASNNPTFKNGEIQVREREENERTARRRKDVVMLTPACHVNVEA